MTITTVIVPDHVELTQLEDSALLTLQAEIAISRNRLDAVGARVSAELSRRSAPELGYSGLAQRAGMRTPEALVQLVSGVSRAEARSLIRVGAALDGSAPWFGAVASAVNEGRLSVAAADGIVAGLGAPTASVAAARSLRDELDVHGVDDREAVLRDKIFLRLIPQANGMTILVRLNRSPPTLSSTWSSSLVRPTRASCSAVALPECACMSRLQN